MRSPLGVVAAAELAGLGPADGLGAFYVGMTKFGLSAFGAITIFGLAVAAVMEVIRRWHRRNTVRHAEELKHLLAIARSDHS